MSNKKRIDISKAERELIASMREQGVTIDTSRLEEIRESFSINYPRVMETLKKFTKEEITYIADEVSDITEDLEVFNHMEDSVGRLRELMVKLRKIAEGL